MADIGINTRMKGQIAGPSPDYLFNCAAGQQEAVCEAQLQGEVASAKVYPRVSFSGIIKQLQFEKVNLGLNSTPTWSALYACGSLLTVSLHLHTPGWVQLHVRELVN